MEVKLVNTEGFYNTMKYWWDGHNFNHVSPSMLPETTFVCFNDEGTPVYSMCFYNTDSNLCWLGWQISNPYVGRDKKEGCFEYLFECAEEYAKSIGYHLIFTTTGVPAVGKVLEVKEYELGDRNVNHYIKKII